MSNYKNSMGSQHTTLHIQVLALREKFGVLTSGKRGADPMVIRPYRNLDTQFRYSTLSPHLF